MSAEPVSVEPTNAEPTNARDEADDERARPAGGGFGDDIAPEVSDSVDDEEELDDEEEAPLDEPPLEDELGDEDFVEEGEELEAGDDEEAEEERPDPSEGRHWVAGVRAGFVSVPSGILHVFVDGGTDKTGAAVGAFFGYQRNRLEVLGSVWWADYSYDDEVIFQTAGDRNDPEFIQNDLSLLTIHIDFVWAHWFTHWLAATYGAGLGLGVVLGDVRRTEATPPTGPYADGTEQPTNGYVHCQYDAGDPSWSTPFCEPMCTPASVADGSCPPRERPSESGDLLGYYNTVEDRIPAVLPWINFLVGIRILPHEHFQIDLQTGFGLGVLFVGRAAYRW